MFAQLDINYIKKRPWKIWPRLISYFFFEGRPITTRGRFINPLVFSIIKFCANLPTNNQVKPLFIVGTGRSGTTILGLILSLHKSISYLNEPKAIWHYLYPNEDVIGNYTMNNGDFIINSDVVNSNIKKRARRIYSNYLKFAGGKVVLDKYPELIFRTEFVSEIFDDSKFIFITRNGYDTLKSISNWSKRLGQTKNEKNYNWWGVDGKKWSHICNELVPQSSLLKEKHEDIFSLKSNIDKAAVEWIVTMEYGLKLLRKSQGNILHVRYEELLENPELTLRSIMNFSNLQTDNKMDLYAKKILKQSSKTSKVEVNHILIDPLRKISSELGYEY